MSAERLPGRPRPHSTPGARAVSAETAARATASALDAESAPRPAGTGISRRTTPRGGRPGSPRAAGARRSAASRSGRRRAAGRRGAARRSPAARTSAPRARRGRRWPPPGRRSSNTRTPAMRDRGPMSTSRSSAPRSSSGVVSTARSRLWWAMSTPEPPRDPGQRRRLDEREDDDEDEHEVEDPAPRRVRPSSRGRSPARPAPRRAVRPTTGTPACATTSRTVRTTR